MRRSLRALGAGEPLPACGGPHRSRNKVPQTSDFGRYVRDIRLADEANLVDAQWTSPRATQRSRNRYGLSVHRAFGSPSPLKPPVPRTASDRSAKALRGSTRADLGRTLHSAACFTRSRSALRRWPCSDSPRRRGWYAVLICRSPFGSWPALAGGTAAVRTILVRPIDFRSGEGVIRVPSTVERRVASER
jgi:hypothetical protein